MNNKNGFIGKVVLVTGGTSGIGKATAIAFARAGAKIVLTGRREKEGAQVVAQIQKLGGDAAFVRADVAKDADVKAMVKFAVDKFGKIDIAFNNAGVEWAGPLDQANEAEYRRIFDINVWGVLNSMRHEIPVMVKNGGGAIINTSSVAGHVGFPQVSVYIASKHAVEGLTKSVALEFAKQNIRINAVAPGPIATEMWDRFAGDKNTSDQIISIVPAARVGTSEEIAAAVLYLASDAAKFTIGRWRSHRWIRRFVQDMNKTHEVQSSDATNLGGKFTFPSTSMTVYRVGYGAMQLAGPGVFGPPHDPDTAIAVLREAISAGVNHIDTSDFYGPHVTNQIIKKALHPYPDGLVIVTKVGARRGADKSWIPALSRQELIDGAHDNLRNLDVDVLDIVNLRVGGLEAPSEGSIAEPLAALVELKREGLIRHIGLSNISPTQLKEAQTLTEIVCVQNFYNVAHRNDDPFIDDLARQGIAYVPFFPLGGFNPLQSGVLDTVTASLHATPMQVALAWLLQRSPNVLLIPGTSSVQHLRENLAAAKLTLPADALARLDAMAAESKQ